MAEYIDREAVLEMLKQECSTMVFAYLADLVNDIPAADVRPVVRGRWEYNPGDNIPYCSECMMPQDSECNFCPNCGAWMEEN